MEQNNWIETSNWQKEKPKKEGFRRTNNERT